MPSAPLRSLRFVLPLCTSLAGCGGGDSIGWMPDVDPEIPFVPPTYDDPDCPPDVPCSYYPAAYQVSNPATGGYGNFDVADRPADGNAIRYIVIHTTEVSYAGTIRLFQDPTDNASAHYLVRSEDGHLVKFISPQHVAWHAGNWYVNTHSVGIEHEAFAAEGPTYFTDALYLTSAKLVRHLAKKYGIPVDRAHVIGHDEVPAVSQARQGQMHWDPGPYWDWDRFMKLAQDGSDPLAERADTGPDTAVVVIRPEFATNKPHVTYCYGPNQASDCRDAPDRASNFVYLHTLPDDASPLIQDPYLTRWPGDRLYNWGNKARTGHRAVRVERSFDWDAIYYGGQKAWFKNTGRMVTRTLGTASIVVTPRSGLASIPAFGVGYPQSAAYQPPTRPATIEKLYDLPAGQKYVAAAKQTADYYWAKVPARTPAEGPHIVVKDGTEYYQIELGHREAFVRAADVDLVPQ